MELFFTLSAKMLPIYFIVFLGFLAGRYMNVTKEAIANILIYFIVPVVVFYGVATTKLTPATLSIPLLFFFAACIVSVVSYFIAGLFWKDSTRNILAFMGGSSNTGYFGLPVAIALFGPQAIGIVALAIMGGSLYNNTIGFFLAAKGNNTTKESIIKILQLPMIYAFFLGIIVNAVGIQIGEILTGMAESFTGTFTVLGVMLVGIGFGDTKRFELDFKFAGVSLVIAYVIWPLLMLAIISFDQTVFQIYDKSLYKMFMLLSMLPIAANMVAYSTILKIQPEKTSFAVMISTLFALLYIPLMAAYFLR